MAKGTIKRRGESWSYVIDVGFDPANGKRRQQRKGGFRTRKLAEAALREVISGLETGAHVKHSTMALGEYLDQWLGTVKARVRPTTWASYEGSVRRIKRTIGAVALQSITPLQIEAFYGALATDGGRYGKGLAPKSVRNTHIVLRKALADAERLGLVQRNAAAAARPPRGKSVERQTWTADELRRFLLAVEDDRLYALWLLLATTGMRRGEALGVRWSDLNLDGGRMAVVQTLTTVHERLVFSPPKTANSRRGLALDPSTAAALSAHRRRQLEERLVAGDVWDATNDLVFRNELGGPLHPSNVSYYFERHVRAAHLPRIRLHDLRHTYATLALTQGVHPKIVSERLGHATVGITLDLYSHVSPSLDAEVATLVAGHILGVRSDG